MSRIILPSLCAFLGNRQRTHSTNSLLLQTFFITSSAVGICMLASSVFWNSDQFHTLHVVAIVHKQNALVLSIISICIKYNSHGSFVVKAKCPICRILHFSVVDMHWTITRGHFLSLNIFPFFLYETILLQIFVLLSCLWSHIHSQLTRNVQSLESVPNSYRFLIWH